MEKLFSLLVSSLLLTVATAASAQTTDTAVPANTAAVPGTEPADSPAAATLPDGPSSAASTSIAPSVPTNPVYFELKDGTKFEIDADGSVFILKDNGSRIAAPGGVER